MRVESVFVRPDGSTTKEPTEEEIKRMIHRVQVKIAEIYSQHYELDVRVVDDGHNDEKQVMQAS